MNLIDHRFEECDKIQDRFQKLNIRVQKSNVAIAKISEKEKKLAVFLVELNNKLLRQKKEEAYWFNKMADQTAGIPDHYDIYANANNFEGDTPGADDITPGK
jgi:hypothetical protein